ncbi:helix-turn-helix domain-containing protein [Brucella pseudintermedia]|uniref:helix-turn-helix domain-containing protein n=1 Tax=Brucella pseudintermedia TaxID=370111 RepID=UPI00124D897C|nr:helix-turn-helix domain-containing protein [Brucella pseudintermedia]KAB2680905.1 helix-turn-helix domain-containing protein [Brucella pseudintermedia]
MGTDRSTVHHAFSQGRPKGHVFQTVSTSETAPADRYDYWTSEVIRTFESAAPDERQRRDFRASVTSLATMAGEMHYAVSDAYQVSLGKKAIASASCDELALFLMLKGRMRYAYEGGQAMEAGEGDFFLLDGSRPLSLSFTRHCCIQLDLSRPLLESVFPRSMPDPEVINAALANSAIAGLLRDHLRQFPRVVTGMAPREQLALLDASESFAITAIEGAFSSAVGVSEHSNAGLFAAAQRYIRRHLASHELNPAGVATAVGCSRSTLYRLFADRDLTVQGYIRELRLQQLLRLLQKENGKAPIHLLAQRCGLYDLPNINRLFRRRFGMGPSEARAAARQHPNNDR